MTQAERGALEKESDISIYFLGSLLSGGGSTPATNNPAEWGKMYDRYQTEALKTRLKTPLIYGIDAVHGHNNVKGAVIMPHNIGLGCTRDSLLVKQVSEVTAKEVAATGIDWTFAPCIAVPKNEQWGRTYEGFGETPELQKMMAAASIEGLQGADLGLPTSILACAKHYVGDGGTTNGNDQGNTEVTEEVLRREHLPGYIAAINEGVGSIMASYSSWNGQKLHGDQYLLTDVLKNELGFQGFVVSDWAGVDQINVDYRIAVKRAINAGIDMVMVPDRYIYFISVLKDLVLSNEVPMTRIDDAVARILKQKFMLNLFAKPFTDTTLLPSVGSTEHRTIARQAVQESVVCLAAKKNVLPLSPSGQKILIAGRLADDLGAQCGGWTISWQGSNGNITDGTTIREAITNRVGAQNVVFASDGVTGEAIDVAVLVIGEDPYAEGAGDRTSLDINDEDKQVAETLAKYGVPVIAVLISGRPMIIGDVLPNTDAFLAAWLPGTEGDGIADILFGDHNPSGKLNHSWPKNMGQVPINIEDSPYDPLYPYGHGLQEFPGSTSLFEPYTASVSDDGSMVFLDLNDTIDAITSTTTDFQVYIDGVGVAITSINHDSGIPERLILHLANPVPSFDSEITTSYDGSGVMSNGMTLQHFTHMYVHNTSVPLGSPIAVPGRVEAENYYAMSGISLEPTTDIGGGENVGWISNGDWMKYYLDTQTAGKYEITARIAGYVGGTLMLDFPSQNKSYSLTYQPTDGWQIWQNFTTTLDLEAGLHTFKVQATTDGFNINYYDFKLIEPILGIEENSIHTIDIYPNPVKRQLNIELKFTVPGNLHIGLYDFKGNLVTRLFDGHTSGSGFYQSYAMDPSLKTGMYMIEVQFGSKRYFKKLIISD